MWKDFNALRDTKEAVVALLDADAQQKKADVIITIVERPPVLDEAAVEHAWLEETRANPRIFNGSVAWVHKYAVGDTITLACSASDFKHLMYLWRQERIALRDFAICAGGVRCLLVTADDKVLLARRGNNVTWPGKILAIPGGLFTADVTTAKEQALIELEEEVGITREEVSGIDFLGMSLEGEFPTLQVKFMLRTPLHSDIVAKRLVAAKDRYETGEFWFVPIDDVPAFIEEHRKDLRPETLDILRHVQAA